MLLFLNYYLCRGGEVILDQETKECYLCICKCGSSSLKQLANTDYKYIYYVGPELSEFLNQHGITEITVFLRDPITRIFSAFQTHGDLYGISIDTIEKFLNSDLKKIPILDEHTIPQFWYLLRAAENNADLKFKLRSLSDIQSIDNIAHVNKSRETRGIKLNQQALDKLDFLYTEDVVMYSQFLNTTTTVDNIIKQIKKEQNFINNIKQYQHQLTYLL